MEMAQWKVLRYALPAFILAGRIAGMNEQEIQKAWTSGDRQDGDRDCAEQQGRRRRPKWGRRTRWARWQHKWRKARRRCIRPSPACGMLYYVTKTR